MYIFGIKRRIRYYGKKELLARREQTRIVTEAYKGYAELEVNHAFPSFCNILFFLKGLIRFLFSFFIWRRCIICRFAFQNYQLL